MLNHPQVVYNYIKRETYIFIRNIIKERDLNFCHMFFFYIPYCVINFKQSIKHVIQLRWLVTSHTVTFS
jgi:hypothetical protein